jgi:low temperature requirement protein LtrA
MGDRGSFARDVYTFGHLPIISGVILIAAALEEIALHPEDELAGEFRWILFAGLALFFGGIAVTVWRAFRVVAKERIVGLALLVVTIAIAGSMSGLVLLIAIDVVLLAVLIAEQLRIEGGPTTTTPPATAPTS